MFDSLKKRFSKAKKSIVKKVTEKKLSVDDFNDFFNEFELSLLQSNVALEVIEAIRVKLHDELVGREFKRGMIEEVISNELREVISDLLIEGDVGEFIAHIQASDDPVSIMFVGTNGSGKTTSIAKVTKFLQDKGISVVLAACDTFRAASIEQLETHANALGVKVIKHSYGSDAAAVAYDALEHAQARGVQVVLIDTAGRSHSNVNLMRELEKVKRVVNPDFTFFVGDALTGNDVVIQCRDFSEATDFDYVILTKTDVDDKGGALLSISHETGVPVLFLGNGQGYGDLIPFKKDQVVKQLV